MKTSRLLSHFRISAEMRPYALRMRLGGTDFEFGSNPEHAVTYSKCIRQMRRLLVEKHHVPTVAADRAILKSLEAAFDFQMEGLRYGSVKRIVAQSQTTLDHLIGALRELRDAVAQLPTSSKGELNKRVSGIIAQTQFDSEKFVELIATITVALPDIRPRKLAENIRSLIYPEPCTEARRPPIINNWEAMPAVTRVKVERMVQTNPSRSLVRWLDNLANLLADERPVLKRGAPRAISQLFVSRVARIWRRLGLDPGLAYNFFLYPANEERVGRGGRVPSTFQRYCRAALTAVGDATEVSARQVLNYKKT